MKSDRKFALTAVVLGTVAASVFGGARSADAALIFQTGSSFSLSSLAPSGGNVPAIQVGDLIFYNFTAVSRSNDAPTANNVTITPETLVLGGQTTNGFKVSGAFSDLSSSTGGSDFLLTYNVASTDGSPIITDAHILGDPSVIGGGAATVTETWTPDVTDKISRIYDIEPGHLTSLSDTVVFGQPYASLSVQKDILLTVPDGSAGTATISNIDQTYSDLNNGGGRTPEPASLSLLGIGGMALIARRRRNA